MAVMKEQLAEYLHMDVEDIDAPDEWTENGIEW
jgi:hypothetical protein